MTFIVNVANIALNKKMFTLQVIVVLAPTVLFNIALFLRKIFATFGFFVAVKDVRERKAFREYYRLKR